MALSQSGVVDRALNVAAGQGHNTISYPIAYIEVTDDRRDRSAEGSTTRIGDTWKLPDGTYVERVMGAGKPPKPDTWDTTIAYDEGDYGVGAYGSGRWTPERVGEIRQYAHELNVQITIEAPTKTLRNGYEVVDDDGTTHTYKQVRDFARRLEDTLLAYELDGASRRFLPDPRTIERGTDANGEFYYTVGSTLDGVRDVQSRGARDSDAMNARNQPIRQWIQDVYVRYYAYVNSLDIEGEYPVIQTVITPKPGDLRADTSDEWPGDIVFTPPGISPDDIVSNDLTSS